jgi:hypothetical protein
VHVRTAVRCTAAVLDIRLGRYCYSKTERSSESDYINFVFYIHRCERPDISLIVFGNCYFRELGVFRFYALNYFLFLSSDLLYLVL